MTTVQENLDDLGRTFDRWWKESPAGRNGRDAALARASRKFSFFFSSALRKKASAKGAITQERTSALEHGEGLRISDRAKELVAKRHGVSTSIATRQQQINRGKAESAYHAQIAQELRLREGHRMFTAMSGRFKGDMRTTTFSYSKGKQVGRATPTATAESSATVFEWSGGVGKWAGVAATGLTNPSRQQAQSEALIATRGEMLIDLARAHEQAARNAARSVRA